MTRVVIGLVLMVWGAAKLLTITGVLDCSWLFNRPWTVYVLPICALLAGFKLFFRHSDHPHCQMKEKETPEASEDGTVHLAASMGGDAYDYSGKTFEGANIEVFMGGISIDLRQAVIHKDVHINVRTFMGGVEIYVPDNLTVLVTSKSFLGGVDNKTATVSGVQENTIYVHAQNFMGGVSIQPGSAFASEGNC
ncbi:MAG: LiaF domain-containing protein [Prevotella sp.]